MAHFSRQKRQSRFYWAELGFLTLGLLGLQPSLFTNLLAGSQSKLSSFKPVFHNQEYPYYPAFDGYWDWMNIQQSSYMPTQSTIGPENQNQRWFPSQTVTSALHPTSYPQSTFLAAQYAQPSTYVLSQPQLFAQQPSFAGTGLIPHYLGNAPQSTNYHPQQHTTQSMQQAVPYGWQNHAASLAATSSGYANNGYTNSNASGYGNLFSAQPTNYGSNTGSYQPSAAYQHSSHNGADSYGGLAPSLAQQPLFESGYNTNRRTGTAITGTAAQNYPYMPNSTSSGAWRPYRPATSIYR
ncbi:MAG TPA: hypothetical protein VM260_02395 [Pirellula sp.]|nr:hypothetical protein [Pirellula sp.]